MTNVLAVLQDPDFLHKYFISLSFVTSFFNPSWVSMDYSSLLWIYDLNVDIGSISHMLHRKGFSSSPLPNMGLLHTKYHIIQVLFVILLCCQNMLFLLPDIVIKYLLGPAGVSAFYISSFPYLFSVYLMQFGFLFVMHFTHFRLFQFTFGVFFPLPSLVFASPQIECNLQT